MKKILIIILIFTSVFANATHYYVSSSDGNDTDSGQTELLAWATISKVNAQTFAAGDIISFKCGDIWRETLTVPNSGASGNHIIFNSYGTGAKPLILGSNISTGWESMTGNVWRSVTTFATDVWGSSPWCSDIFFYDGSAVVSWGTHVVDTASLTTEYHWTQASGYIYVYAATDPDSRYSKIEIPQRNYAVFIGDLNQYITIDGLDIRHAQRINVYDNDPAVTLTGFTLTNCHISHVGCRDNGIGTTEATNGYNVSVLRSDMLIQGNEIHEGGRRQIAINCYDISDSSWDNIIIDDNYIHDGYHGSGMGCDVADRPGNVITNVRVSNNIFSNPGDRTSTDPGDPSSFGAFRARATLSSISNVWIYNNVFKYPSNYGMSFSNIDNVYIYHNTFYDLNHHFPSGSIWELEFYGVDGDYNRNVKVKNNIFFNSGTYSYNHSVMPIGFHDGQVPAEVDMNYNFFTCTDPLTILVGCGDIGGVNYKTVNWADIKTTYGWQINEPTLNSDPLFVDDPTDVHIQTSSPAIGAGTPIAEITTDIEGNARNSTPSIGAYELSTGVSIPVVTTTTASSITTTTASSGGNVTNDGGATVTARGVCWSETANPTTAGSHTTDGSGTGSFSSYITGLSANTLYHYRAYATNSVGTSYGAEYSFTTESVPVVGGSPILGSSGTPIILPNGSILVSE